jgi:trk system potassium uptake protein TrkH
MFTVFPAMLRVAPLQTALAVLHVLAGVVMLFSATMVIPLAVAVIYWDAALRTYEFSILITFSTGLGAWIATRPAARELQTRDGFLPVVLVWSVLPAFAALPFLFYAPERTFTDAYFESISALTTTGATVFTGLDELPPSINIWRGLLQWLGGMGIIVLAVAILPLLRVGGRQLYKAETPGPMKDTKLTPRIAETAKWLWIVYAGLTLLCIACYWLAGMSPFDSVMHAFTTLSLGGFSSHDASYGHFNSPVIEAVAVVFMLIAAVNFATHFTALHERRVRPYRTDPEASWLAAALVAGVGIVAGVLWQHSVYPDAATTLRHALFNTISIATTTGYATVDYNLWPALAPFLMLFMASTVSSAGSTGGGIKMIRTRLLFMQGWREMLKILHPQAEVPIKFGGVVIPNQIVFAVLAFMSMYGASVTVMTLMLLGSGLDFVTAFSAIIACITCAGPGLNQGGPATTYAGFTDFQKWVCASAMLLGRLELFTVFVLFTPAFWRK